jgi:hypothetical protein
VFEKAVLNPIFRRIAVGYPCEDDMELGMVIAALGFSMFATVLTLIGRKYLPAYVAKKAENLATKEDIATITRAVENIKAEYEADLEKLRHELEISRVRLQGDIDRAALEHQVRFSWYHQRKAELIATIYALLNDVIEYSMQTTDDVARTTHATATLQLYNKLAQEYWGKKIFLAKEVCDHIEAVIKTVREAITDFQISQDPEGGDRQLWRKAYKSMIDDIPPLMRNLEENFRTMLSNVGTAA